MADQAMDPCECISQGFAVRRLLSLLRQTQAYCMDTQCLEELNNQDGANGSDYYLIMTIMFGLIMVLFFLRPRSSQGLNTADQKIPGNNQGPQPPPDATFN